MQKVKMKIKKVQILDFFYFITTVELLLYLISKMVFKTKLQTIPIKNRINQNTLQMLESLKSLNPLTQSEYKTMATNNIAMQEQTY